MTDIGEIEEITPAVVIPIQEPIPSVKNPKETPVEKPVKVPEKEPVPVPA